MCLCNKKKLRVSSVLYADFGRKWMLPELIYPRHPVRQLADGCIEGKGPNIPLDITPLKTLVLDGKDRINTVYPEFKNLD